MEKRTFEIKIRLTEKEWLLIKEKSQKPKVAQWLRELILRHVKDERIFFKKNTIDPLVLRHLVGLGNNVNQIARIANKTNNLGALIELNYIQQELKAIREFLNDN